ncbi:hypothetical protein TNCV_3615741 [Trichonephila clavipes]|nr:hypothetical protein TNCV_3615741 [Trichonephila clavipes]
MGFIMAKVLLTPIVIRSFEHHTGDRTIAGFHPNFEGEHPGVVRGLPPTSREDLWLEGYLKYLQAVKALYIYKHPCLLRDSNPGPRHSSQRR